MSSTLARWLATVAGLRGQPLKVCYAESELDAGAAGDLARALDGLCQSAAHGHPAAKDVLGAFVPVLVDPAFIERIAGVRDAAREAKLPAACRLLRCSTARGHWLDREEPRPPPQELTLGQRRALARKPSRAQLVKLMSDPHPLVVRIVLGNPKLTEDDVVIMAAKRPARREALVEIAKTCSHRPRARMALVLNPGTAPAVAVPLLGLLSRTELGEVTRATDVAAVVRATARMLRELRPPTTARTRNDCARPARAPRNFPRAD